MVTITVTCYSWAPSSGDHLFTCGAIFWSPQMYPSHPPLRRPCLLTKPCIITLMKVWPQMDRNISEAVFTSFAKQPVTECWSHPGGCFHSMCKARLKCQCAQATAKLAIAKITESNIAWSFGKQFWQHGQLHFYKSIFTKFLFCLLSYWRFHSIPTHDMVWPVFLTMVWTSVYRSFFEATPNLKKSKPVSTRDTTLTQT